MLPLPYLSLSTVISSSLVYILVFLPPALSFSSPPAVTVFQHKFYYSVYHAVGWGVPVLMTAAWATATAMHYGSSRSGLMHVYFYEIKSYFQAHLNLSLHCN